MKKFEEKESHKHRLAKELLASWFKAQEIVEDFCQVAQFKWRRNYGAFVELKFYETSDPYYFELSKGLKQKKGDNPLEWFDNFTDRGRILFVPDITIFHKGTPTLLIEVVHKNPLSPEKIQLIKKFFAGHHVELYEIEAEEILKHVGIPKRLKTQRIF